MTRMTTDVDALGHLPADRADHHGQRGPDVRRRTGRAAAHQLPAGCHAARRSSPVLVDGHAWCSARSPRPGLRRCPREGQHRQRRPAGERRRTAGPRRRTGAKRAQPGAFCRPEQQLPGRSRLRAQRYIALYFPFVQLLSTARRGPSFLFVAAGEVHRDALTAGGLIAYLLYIDLLFSPVQQLSQVFDGYNQAAVGPAADQGSAAGGRPARRRPRTRKPTGRPRGQIEFRDVRFRYSGQHAGSAVRRESGRPARPDR